MNCITVDGRSYGVGDIVHIKTMGDSRSLVGVFAPLQIFVVRENEEMDSLELCRVSAGALKILNPEAYGVIINCLSDTR